MTQEVLSQLGIPLILTVLLVYYAVRLLVFHDVEGIRPPGRPPVRKEVREQYAREAGIVMLLFGAASLIMAVISLFLPLLGMLWILPCIALVFWRFKVIEDKYT